MTFQKYPEYKDSDVEWLGEMPGHWIRGSLKNLAWIRNGKDYKDVESSDGEYPVIGSGGMFSKASQYLHDGESVLLGRKGTIDKPLYINGRFWTVDTMFYTEVAKGTSAKFLYYYALTIPFEFYSTSTALPSMTQGDLLNHPAAIPSNFEQTQIARFLDHETARIDALIEEQQRLIELLKEKRQSVISHAVTKGLDPTVPMKDSGVEWLGEVPAHWVVCATRRVIRFIEQGWSPECESYPAEEDGWGVLKAGCVNRGFFDASENKTLPSSLNPIPEYEVRAGDILMSRASGSPELVGSTALLGQVRERLMLSDKIFRIHLEEKVSNQFFVWVMNAQFMRSQIEQALSGGNGLANNLPQSSLLAFWLAIPPEHEQCAIAELINEQTGRIDELIVEGDVAVELLQERRSALISAAVTGKIDVRGWQPPANVLIPELVQEAV